MTIPMVNEFIYLTRVLEEPINQPSSSVPRSGIGAGVISQSKSIDLPKRLRFRAVYHRALMNLFYGPNALHAYSSRARVHGKKMER